MRWLTLLLIAPLSAHTAAAQAAPPPPPVSTARALAGFDPFVASVMQEWHVPGLALGVIRDGRPVFLKGYGHRDAERRLPVTERTLMAIGSNSKSFTVVLMAMLADSGKLEWNKPVRTYLPDFELSDQFATREMTPRDLVTHTSGLPRHDALWYGRPFTREELYRRLKYLEPSASLRSRWQYQNLMYMTAGYLVERLTGRTWDDLIRERIFAPLDMKRSNTSVRALATADDAALAYRWRACPEEKPVAGGSASPAAPPASCGLAKLPYRNLDAIAPAGSINSSVEEMLHYVQFHIDSGRFGSRAILSKDNAVRMQTPQMLVGSDEIWPDELGVATYGLGLSVTSYRGRKLVQHGGGIDGFISQMAWMPKERIGVVVLTNMSGNNPVPNIVTRNVFDRFLGLEPIDWVGRVKKQRQEADARQKKEKEERAAERKPNTTPSHALSAYAGAYEHPAYGRLEVRVNGNALGVSFDGFSVRLKHFHYDVFEIEEDPENLVALAGRITFLMDRKGDIARMAVPFEREVKDIEFTRVKNP
jgi:CubicO group peptidase (beta-lactamase class C family)